jgi:hypothetical protein
MKAAIVLLADQPVQNLARRMVFELNTRYDVPFFASLLPSHVSLKQPFAFEDMDVLETYFDGLAARIAPLEITLDRLYCETWSGYGIIGMNVVETPRLRALHDQINEELTGLFRDTRAPHDGSGYHFHLTVEMGKLGETNPFGLYYDGLPGDKRLDLRFTARELGLFFYPERGGETGSFITYRVQPLAGGTQDGSQPGT